MQPDSANFCYLDYQIIQLIIVFNRTLQSSTLDYKDIRTRKTEFEAKTQFLDFSAETNRFQKKFIIVIFSKTQKMSRILAFFKSNKRRFFFDKSFYI